MSDDKKTSVSELSSIQSEIRVPKTHRNNFGKYMYRTTEDILEAVKPLLNGAALKISDEIVMLGDRFYVKATATLYCSDGTVFENTALAREPALKKGMDESQITGTASSYARKICLAGLFLLDETTVDVDEKDPGGEDASYSDKIDQIKRLIEETGTPLEGFLKWAGGAECVDDIPANKIGVALETLQRRKKAAETRGESS